MHLCYECAIKHNNYDLLNLLLKSIYQKNIYKFSLLKVIIDNNDENLFNYLIKQNKILHNELDNYMTTFNFSTTIAKDIEHIDYIKKYIKENIIK